MKGAWKHVCNRCGDCCRQHPGESCTVIIYPSELPRVAAAWGMSSRAFAEQCCEESYLELSGVEIPVLALRFVEDHCMFLNGQNRCDIYEDRPYQCRMFDEGYFSEFILAERNIACVEGLELPELTDQGNAQEFALAMELLNGYDLGDA